MEIIKQKGKPHHAFTTSNIDGKPIRVERLPEVVVWDIDTGELVEVADYDTHFLYENPNIGQSRWMCTCGGVGVMVGTRAYEKDASPAMKSSHKGKLLVCMIYHQFGDHTNLLPARMFK